MKIKTAEQFVTSPSNYTDAIVAGGYLRDLVFNKEPSDIDIFIPMASPHATPKLYISLRYDGSWGLTAFKNEFLLEDDCEYSTQGFRSMRCAAFPKLNIILVPRKDFPKPEDIVANFTCSLSQIWMRPGSNMIHFSKQFITDYYCSTITFREDATEKYREKIHLKYAPRWGTYANLSEWAAGSEEAL